MSIFESIKNAIWGHAPAVPPATLPGTVPPPPTGVMPGVPPAGPALPAGPVPPSTQPAVDVNAILTGLAAKQSQTLDWQHSIVDLMKLLGLDSSFQNRVALAKELGYTSNPTDTATMNVWLYQQVMAKLAQAGGNVPAVSADMLRRGG